jgi:predicted nucleotidyltransferase
LLYGQPHADFYTNEIIRHAQSGTGAVQRELARLTAAGLVTVRQMGNQKRYQANQDTVFFGDLRALILKTFGLADELRAVLHADAAQIEFAFIYGSIASQEDHAHSDVDLIIITQTLTYTDLFEKLKKVEKKIGRKINPVFYAMREWQHKKKAGNNFVAQVEKKQKIFLVGTEDAFIKTEQSG